MKAVRIASSDPARLEIAELPTPVPGAGQALVRVIASGLNRADLLQLHGNYPIPADAPADIPGIEFAGVVETLGPGCTQVALGQRVLGLANGGAHAQYLVSPQELLVGVPEPLGDIAAGAVAEAFITVHDALVTQAALQPGERVLVHAAGSGVGIAALQLASAWGCRTFATARSQAKVDALGRLGGGPARALASTFACLPDSFDREILARTAGEGVDVILDPVGAPYYERNLNAIAPRGRIVYIATMGGTTVSLKLPVLMRKRLRLIGTVLRGRSLAEKAAATGAFEREVLPKIASGMLAPIVDRTFALEQAADAYKYMEDNRNFGKIVLSMA